MSNAVYEAEGDGRDVPGDLLYQLRHVKYGVGSDDYRKAKAVVNRVTSPIIRSLQKIDLVLKPEYVGSSFEGTKTLVSDFDILVILNGSKLTVEEITPQFSSLSPRPSAKQTFIEFLTSESLVDPREVRSKFQSWISKEITDHPDVGDQGDFSVRMGPSGPAITLVIERNSSSQYQGVDKISVDLVPAFKVSDLYFVAKPCKRVLSGQTRAAIPNTAMLWRKSFSLREKEALKCIDRDGGCRRECLKILKFMRLRDSTLKYLASYHYKVLVLKECEKYPEREDWAANRLAVRLWRALESLLDYLEIGCLPHVFDPRINTFDTVSDKTALENVRGRVRRLLNKGSVGITEILTRDPEPRPQPSPIEAQPAGNDLQQREEENRGPWNVIGGIALGGSVVLGAIAAAAFVIGNRARRE